MQQETNGNFPFVPGAMMVKHIPRRSTEYFCKACQAFIQPMWIRKGNAIFPSCRECFNNDLAATDVGEIYDATTAVVVAESN